MAHGRSYVVFWEDANDPSNPRNWRPVMRWTQIIVIGVLTFITSLSSSMLAPAVPQTMQSLQSNNNQELDSFVVSVYVIGGAVGALVVAPCSEIWGRAIVYHASNFLFILCSIGCALSVNAGMLVAFRFLSGFVGMTPLVIGPSTIADIMPPESIGLSTAIWAVGSLIAPVIAPVGGGYLGEAAGWRWIFWLIAILAGVMSLISLLTLRETNAIIILERKAATIRKQTGNPNFHSGLASTETYAMLLQSALIRPIRFLLMEPTVTVLALYVAIVYGYTYLVFTTLSFIFQDQYHFSEGATGLTYLGEGIGTLIGVFTIGSALDYVTHRRQKAAQSLPPELWLWPMAACAPLLSASLFWYGWSLEYHAQPIVPLVGLGVFGFAIIAVLQPAQAYLMQAFPMHAATATAGMSLLRNIVGACLPLSGRKLYDALGLGWGNSLLAFIAVVLIPLPVVLMYWGKKLRELGSAREMRETPSDMGNHR